MSKRQFEKFYNKHFDKVYRFIFFRVNANKDVAEDLVSEIFLKALKNFVDYDDTKSKSAWIMTIAHNHLVNYWRDKKETVSIMAQTDYLSAEEGVLVESRETSFFQADIAKDSLKQNQIIQELEQVLQWLNDNEREIVTLHYLSGYSYTEIGEMKQMTEIAVKVAAHRALKKLKK
jgi:RNA polymerase sigma-70 factor (ECF subfamily)